MLPISDKYNDYANKVLSELKKNGILATVDGRAEKIGPDFLTDCRNKITEGLLSFIAKITAADCDNTQFLLLLTNDKHI